jgi:hypothetical protein
MGGGVVQGFSTMKTVACNDVLQLQQNVKFLNFLLHPAVHPVTTTADTTTFYETYKYNIFPVYHLIIDNRHQLTVSL